ncbi:hypothetical protein U9M48_005478 [Paspalum notatum var. saurae]|uniref:Uncharacterized protein n=1 Tax=Paspalum notatum var. saurae TaxID=547442 RepID=A0AAQ3SLE8_PASNO
MAVNVESIRASIKHAGAAMRRNSRGGSILFTGRTMGLLGDLSMSSSPRRHRSSPFSFSIIAAAPNGHGGPATHLRLLCCCNAGLDQGVRNRVRVAESLQRLGWPGHTPPEPSASAAEGVARGRRPDPLLSAVLGPKPSTSGSGSIASASASDGGLSVGIVPASWAPIPRREGYNDTTAQISEYSYRLTTTYENTTLIAHNGLAVPN